MVTSGQDADRQRDQRYFADDPKGRPAGFDDQQVAAARAAPVLAVEIDEIQRLSLFWPAKGTVATPMPSSGSRLSLFAAF